MIHFKKRRILLCFLAFLFLGTVIGVEKADKYSYLDIDGIDVAPRSPNGVKVLIADQFTPGHVLYATTLAVYTLDVSSWDASLIVGGKSRRYAEGIGSSALFVQISAMEIGPLTSNFWVADYATGCIREVNRFTAQTQPIITNCTYIEGGVSWTGLPWITSLCKTPGSLTEYYASTFGGSKLVSLTNEVGHWIITELLTIRNSINDIKFSENNYYFLTSTTLFVGAKGTNLYTAVVRDFNITLYRTKKLLVLNKRTFLMADRGDDIKIVDVVQKRKFSMCHQFGRKKCQLQSVVDMVKHPTKPDALLAAGSKMYTISYREQGVSTASSLSVRRHETTSTTFQNKKDNGVLEVVTVVVLITIAVTVIVITIIYARKLLAKGKKRRRKTDTRFATTFPMSMGPSMHFAQIPVQNQPTNAWNMKNANTAKANPQSPKSELLKKDATLQQKSALKIDSEKKKIRKRSLKRH